MTTPPPPAERVATTHYAQQVALAKATSDAILTVWAGLDLAAIARGWATLLRGPLAILTAAQQEAAAGADRYVGQVLEAQGIQGDPTGLVNPGSLAGIASDGRPLDSLLFEPAIATLQAIKQGAAPTRAQVLGAVRLDAITRTQVADAGRVADGMAVAARAQVGGYVRMLNPPSCSRCVVLAGKFYEWNAGFERHPRCDCRHIPAAEDLADDLRTEPRQYFDSLSPEEQDRAFTQAGAQAIRDGADVSQVVNARRGMETAGESRTRVNDQGLTVNERHRTLTTRRVFGQGAFTTTEGITRRGVAGHRLGKRNKGVRLMPEQIYLEAHGNREEAIRLLRLHGYII